MSKLVYDKDRRTIVLEAGDSRFDLTKVTEEKPSPAPVGDIAGLVEDDKLLAANLVAATIILDEPFHHEAIADTMKRAADRLMALSRMEEREKELTDALGDFAAMPCETEGVEDLEPGCCRTCRARNLLAGKDVG